jgi:hypothetical protein
LNPLSLREKAWIWLSSVGLGYGLITAVSGIWAEKAILGNGLPPFEISPLYPYLDYAVAPESLLIVSLFGVYLLLRKQWRDALLVPLFAGPVYDAEWTLLRYYSGLKPLPVFVANLPVFWALVLAVGLVVYWKRIQPRALLWFGVIGAYILTSQLFFPTLDTRMPLELAFCAATCYFLKVPFLPAKLGPALKEYLSKQTRFSIANLPSVPVGLALIYVFTKYGGLWYEESAVLSLLVTTVMNFWVNVFLRVIRLEGFGHSDGLQKRQEAGDVPLTAGGPGLSGLRSDFSGRKDDGEGSPGQRADAG